MGGRQGEETMSKLIKSSGFLPHLPVMVGGTVSGRLLPGGQGRGPGWAGSGRTVGGCCPEFSEVWMDFYNMIRLTFF